MKKIFVLMLTVLLAAPVFSQIKFGAKAAASTDFTFTKEDFTNGDAVDKAKNAKWGIQGGVFVRATLKNVYIQPEFLFATATNSVTYNDATNNTETVYNQKFNKVNIPVLVGYKLSFLRINVGPAASFLINSPNDLGNRETFKKATFGYQAGVGMDIFNKISLDARYEGNLNRFSDYINSEKIDDRTSSLVISVGWIF